MGDALRHADDIEVGAQERARAIVASAEEAALKARADAHRRIEETGAQFNELLRMKDNLLETMRGVVGDFEHAIARVERGESLFTPPAGVPAAEPPAPVVQPPVSAPPPRIEYQPPPEPEPEPEPPPAAVQPVAAEPEPEREPEPTPPPLPEYVEPVAPEPVAAARSPRTAGPHDDQIFEPRVELDAGPFSDFASLSAFERALAQLAMVDDVYVRRLAEDRALIELTLSEPSPLLAAMFESLPYELDVRSANRSKLVLNVHAESTAGTR